MSGYPIVEDQSAGGGKIGDILDVLEALGGRERAAFTPPPPWGSSWERVEMRLSRSRVILPRWSCRSRASACPDYCRRDAALHR
jgi:hypothetical protein